MLLFAQMLLDVCLFPRVAQSPDTKMDISNLAKVFGPTIVAHAVSDPDPMTLLQDTKRQPRVGRKSAQQNGNVQYFKWQRM